MSTQPVWHIPEWTLGDRLRKAREDAGMSQAELALAVGVSRNTIGNAEVGATVPLTVTLRAWAEATKVPADWLLYGQVSPTPPRRGGRGRTTTAPYLGDRMTDTELMQKRYPGLRPNRGLPLKVPA